MQPPFYSRISNATVLATAGCFKLTTQLEKRQLLLLGQILRSPADGPLKRVSFIPNTLWPATEQFVRRRGRPAKEWIKDTMDRARRFFGMSDDVSSLAMNEQLWRAAVDRAMARAAC